jgi:hypothetical protein
MIGPAAREPHRAGDLPHETEHGIVGGLKVHGERQRGTVRDIGRCCGLRWRCSPQRAAAGASGRRARQAGASRITW